ncbi:response regulator [Pleionea sp. CnH1-48]|uniref:response regulator n=1 Tax=Pleionea sp. CnH1-48 TaxID=2954494 RepID=UPI002097686F|nr:response regulator [Pleionea sp. CnH1-48]
MRFLIVDDSLAMQSIVKKILIHAGYHDCEYQGAENGRVAFEIIKVWKPDLVLCDWHMPEMTGLELLQKIQQCELEVNIGMVTTETSVDNLQAAKEAGALFIVNKPFTSASLKEAILPILAGREKEEKIAPISFPQQLTLNKIFGAFIKNDVEVLEQEIQPLDEGAMPFAVGLFSDNDKRIRCVSLIDFQAACRISGAFLGVSPSKVEAVIKTGEATPQMIDALERIMNIFSTLIVDPETMDEMSLYRFQLVTKSFPKITSLNSKPSSKRKNYYIEIDEYGGGQFLFEADV